MNREHIPPDGCSLNLTRCRESVWPRNAHRFYQCKHKAVVDDKWCKQHSPAAKEAREKASKERRAARLAHSPLVLLAQAQDRIKELEAEISQLRGVIDYVPR